MDHNIFAMVQHDILGYWYELRCGYCGLSYCTILSSSLNSAKEDIEYTENYMRDKFSTCGGYLASEVIK